MKPGTILLFALLFLCNNLCGQESKTIKVKAGEDIMEVLTAEYIYRYPGFTPGKVFFRTGTKSSARLNYNLLNNEMQFIDPKGDTLAIANEETVKFVTVGNDTFYYDQGFVEMVAGYLSVKLGRKEVIKMDKQKIGGYDQPASGSSITSYSIITTEYKTNKLTIRENVILSKAFIYYLGDTYNHFLPANKKNLFKMFGIHQKDIEKYLKDNPVNYYKEDDMRKLVAFLQSL